MVTDGYGNVVFENFFGLKLPITLGRDFAGILRGVGQGVKDLKEGDEVMGVVPPQSGTGSHAQFVVVDCSCVVLKPSNLSMIEAASIPYAGLTAWAGLTSIFAGNLSVVNNGGKVVLVMGASGGVGSIAVQLCKLWGCKVELDLSESKGNSTLLRITFCKIQVVSTCSTDAVHIVEGLGPDVVIDYKSPDADKRLKELGGFGSYMLSSFPCRAISNDAFIRFDVVLDCTGRKEDYDFDLLKTCAGAKYLTLIPPILRNFDTYGVIGGFAKTLWDLFTSNALLIFRLKTLRWVLFEPNSTALVNMRDFAQNEKVLHL